MANTSVNDAIGKALAAHLKLLVPELVSVFQDFPSPNQKMKYPSATIYTKTPSYESVTPYVISHGVKDIPSNKTPVRRCVGMYEFKLQLDIWTDTKFQRNQIYDKIFNGINSDPQTMGLRLQLTNYFDEWAGFSITGFGYGDSEANSQRGEWRAKIDLVCDVKAIQETMEFLMENIENTIETPEGTITDVSVGAGSVDLVI